MTKQRLFLPLAMMAAFCLGPGLVQSQKSIQIWSGGFGPSKDVRISSPKFVWQVWTEGDAKITSAEFMINGKVVDAKYDNVKKELFVVSDKPLSAGTYEVQAKVQVDNWAKFDKKWTVTIRQDAVINMPSVSDDARQIIDEYNRIRTEHGMAPCRFDPFLDLAANAHTKYMTINRIGGHGEDPSKPGFTGAEPKDRMGLFGHVGSSWEVVSMGAEDPVASISGLWDAPYHRINMMKPGPGIVGASFKNRFLTMDGDGSKIDGVYVSPPSDGKNVARGWENHEVPNPTRRFPEADGTVGYPVVFTVYGDEIDQLQILECSFNSSTGKKVDRYELSPENDEHLSSSVILIPKKPLDPATKYSVSLKVKDNKGKIHMKSWQFTTK